ncbi:lipopolysaccharide biosynthesis protein RfbH [Clostridium estertheticum]|uniref:lipopolysaccharide biosynthesis protein RfbH n=1 Tax=Clostridium estertheticum TaxID=238834 RepID=UPI001CF383C9|nr:lipopolysaccharide biosynthesis protein RfbH [Clostridium estertheticum]MCB2309104.1 lipopolysaccharide biosynthesis protein RfbH [Clostridium estertheticum]MCB2347617.1 lipopolysaccharide biosynthesis protein RfbH [Clostridium estertheticum]MCB2352098.1 lipopolysaccharide biosynthesis protein RfbH [Clostridium estertheticum]WAG44143.1 lipopolysaccharide biosynthesis protein RfbH [Clostridium estertheticum]
MPDKESLLRLNILENVREYYDEVFKNKEDWTEGNKINYGGRYFDEDEMINLTEATLDFWLTTGRFCDKFEKEFAQFLGVKYCSLTNSGSSANLLAFMALTSPKLKNRRIKKGDEVITVAAGFPTTIAPILQYGAVPVFVDITLPTYNIDVNLLEDALSDKTKAVMIAHTLGNPFNLERVKEFCDKNNLWLIEDNCDALGSQYEFKGELKYTGTIGDIGTSSFYPPHHITMGEGGAVYTNNVILNKIIESFRDWGRDCYCKSGCDNTCKKRFDIKYGDMPLGYDHKYIYSHLGYNLKVTEMQASIGCAQLKKLPGFIDKRRENWELLKNKLIHLDEYLILPEAEKNSKPSWFGFLMTIKDSSINRRDLLQYLEDKGIQTRLLFAGNITRQPLFEEYKRNKESYRIVGKLTNTDLITTNSFWLGVYPGINENMINYMASSIEEFIMKNIRKGIKL